MATDEEFASLMLGGNVSPEIVAQANAMVGDSGSGEYVWLPGVKRKVDRNLREGRRGDFMGHGRANYEDKEFFGSDREGGQDELLFGKKQANETGRVDMSAVINWMHDPKRATDIQAKMVKLGFDVKNWTDAFALWQEVVKNASNAFMSSGGRIKVSPWDMLETMKPSKEEIAARTRTPWRGMSFEDTQTNVDMAEMPPETVRGAITEMLQRLLGRGPTDEEVNDFAARAAAVSAENPYTQTAVTTNEWDPNATPEGGDYRQTGRTVTESGVSEEELTGEVMEMARDKLKNNPEAEGFAEVRGLNVLASMLGPAA